MSISELSTSLKALFYERSKSPFYGTFIVAWLAWNWRGVYFLFADNPACVPEDKIDFIMANYAGLWPNLLNPLWSSLLVFVIGGLISIGFLWIKIKLNNLRKEKVEKEEMWSKKETTERKKELIEMELRIATTTSDLKTQLEGAQTMLSEKTSAVDALNEEIQKYIVREQNAEKQIAEAKEENVRLGAELETLRIKVPARQPPKPRDISSPEKGDIQDDYNRDLEWQNGVKERLRKKMIDSYPAIIEASSDKRSFETISADFLKNKEGALTVWVEVNDNHNTGNDMYRYILGHDSNNGLLVGSKFHDAWALSKEKNHWCFWTTNTKGDGMGKKLVDKRKLGNGWHLFSIVWSTENNFIHLYVDERKRGSSEFINWPDKSTGNLYIGTWPSLDPKNYIETKVGNLKIYSQSLVPDDIRYEFRFGSPDRVKL